MQKENSIGLFLIFLIIILSFWLIQPDTPKPEAQPSNAEKTEGNASKEGEKSQSQGSEFHIEKAESSKEEKFFSLKNDELELVFTNKGGIIHSAELLNYNTYYKKRLILIKAGSHKFGFDFIDNNIQNNTAEVYFDVIDEYLYENRIIFILKDTQGNPLIEYEYSLPENGFQMQHRISMARGLNLVNNAESTLNWKLNLSPLEKSIDGERYNSSIYYMYDDMEWDYLSQGTDDKETLNEDKIRWLSYKQHFFNVTLIPQMFFESAHIKSSLPDTDNMLMEYESTIQLTNFKGSSMNIDWMFAPNKYNLLKGYGNDLHVIVKMGYWILKYINKLVFYLFDMLNGFNINIGIIIIIMTLILKIIIFPLTYKSYISMAKMRVIKPEMEAIKKKVGNNQERLQQEYLSLYKKAGVNPLGGCIPLLLQMPLVMSFFFFFPNLFELRQVSFLWMDDLSTYDSIISFPTIPLIGLSHLSITCLLFTISQIFYTYFNSSQMSTGMGGAQYKYIAYFMPLIFFIVLNSFSAGLNFYYLCSNLLTFVQQWLIRKKVDEKEIKGRIDMNKEKNKNKPKGKFQARLEAYMKAKKKELQQNKNKLNKNKK